MRRPIYLRTKINQKTNLYKACLLGLFLACLSGCSSTKYVPDGQYLLDNVKISSTDKSVRTSDLQNYLRQTPNSKWFSWAKVPLYIYGWSGRDTTRWINKMLRRIGDAPVIYDEEDSQQSELEMEKTLHNWGYMQATIRRKETIKKKKIKLFYEIEPGRPYLVTAIKRVIPDTAIARILAQEDSTETLLKKGIPLTIETLDKERSRITQVLKNKGYYKFNKEYLTYTVDTISGQYQATVTLYLSPYENKESKKPHTLYSIRNVNVVTNHDILQPTTAASIREYDTIRYHKLNILSHGKPYLRPKVLERNISIRPDSLYREQDVTHTYSNFGRLSILKYTNMRFHERADSTSLDCYLLLTRGKSQSISFSLEGTNSAGDLGAAASITSEHRNLFRGSETFSLELRGAYEAISGLTNAITNQYTEYGVQGRLDFPRFLFPFLSSSFRGRIRANTELSVGYSNQKRPEFARNIFEGRWSYKWNRRRHHSHHRLDLIDVSYIKMPWISEEYEKNYLDNSILKYNYDDQMIMKVGYGIVFNSAGIGDFGLFNKQENGFTIRANFESAGNILYGISKLTGQSPNGEGRYSSFGLPYEQYLKGNLDFSKKLTIDERNSLAMHVLLGVAYPYGNSSMLPFSVRYFAGGANGVRGWSVRGLGPGRFVAEGSSIDFMNRSGDIKLDLSIELRTKLFWKLNGAFFVDAGNIWTIRDYPSQPGGAFHFNSFYKEIAASYGLGIRFDFDYFILRFDGAMKAVNPAYRNSKEHYPIIHPDLSRDFTFHFAIGYPF